VNPATPVTTTWVLLRGLTRESRHWGDLPQRLQAAWPQARIVTLDLPGNGALNDCTSPTRVEAMAAFCHAELQRLGHRAPCHLLAMSLGAMVAVAWAEHYPQDVAAAVLINTSLRPYSRFWQRLQPRNYAVLLRCLLGGASADTWERTVLRLTSRAPRSPAQTAELLQRWVTWRTERPVSRANALRQLLAALRYRAPAVPPACALLLLGGADDRLVSPRCSAALAQAWQRPFHVKQGAGHDLPLDAPDWLIDQLQHWLATPEGQTFFR
jgi:pimeloyl-ACP methyl ester carboxylesterase